MIVWMVFRQLVRYLSEQSAGKSDNNAADLLTSARQRLVYQLIFYVILLIVAVIWLASFVR